LLACEHVNCPCVFWVVRRMSCSDHTMTSRATFNSSQLPIGSSALCVPNRHPIWCMGSFPSLFNFCTDLAKVKSSPSISYFFTFGSCFFNLFVLFKKIYEIGFFYFILQFFLFFRFFSYSFN